MSARFDRDVDTAHMSSIVIHKFRLLFEYPGLTIRFTPIAVLRVLEIPVLIRSVEVLFLEVSYLTLF